MRRLTLDSEWRGGFVGVRLDGDLAGVFKLATVDDQLSLLALFDDLTDVQCLRLMALV